MVSAAPTPTPVRQVLQRLWLDLPLVWLAVSAPLLVRVFITHLDPPRRELACRGMLPLAVVVLLAAARWWRCRLAVSRQRSAWLEPAVPAALAGLGALLCALCYCATYPRPIQDMQLARGYELLLLGSVGTLAAQRYSCRRSLPSGAWLAAAVVYALALCNVMGWLAFVTVPEGASERGWAPATTSAMAGAVVLVYLSAWVGLDVSASASDPRQLRSSSRAAAAATCAAITAALALAWPVTILTELIGVHRWHPLLRVVPAELGELPGPTMAATVALVLPFTWMTVAWRADAASSVERRWPWRRMPLLLLASAALFAGLMLAADGDLGRATLGVLRIAAVRMGLVHPDALWVPGE